MNIEAWALTPGARIRVTTGDGGQFIGTWWGPSEVFAEIDLRIDVVNVGGERRLIPHEVLEACELELLGHA